MYNIFVCTIFEITNNAVTTAMFNLILKGGVLCFIMFI